MPPARQGRKGKQTKSPKKGEASRDNEGAQQTDGEQHEQADTEKEQNKGEDAVMGGTEGEGEDILADIQRGQEDAVLSEDGARTTLRWDLSQRNRQVQGTIEAAPVARVQLRMVGFCEHSVLSHLGGIVDGLGCLIDHASHVGTSFLPD